MSLFLTVFMLWDAATLRAQTWQTAGPKPISGAQAIFNEDIVGPSFHASGRVAAVAPDPTMAGRIFVGTANGGLWMITNAANSSPC